MSANDYITAFSSSTIQSQERILHEWFANYLRLRDGFVLFESGERRHAHDVDSKTCREFPSRLQTKPKFNDNTQTFSSKLGYTGYGMDEFNDEVVGVRKRLLDQLIILKGESSKGVGDKIWNRIMEDDMVDNLWNMSFDQIVAVTSSLRRDLTSIQSKFVAEINQFITTHWRQRSNIGKLKLVADDKAERISFGSMDVCREGNNFKLLDKGGSLPIGMSVMDWKKKFRPSVQKQKASKPQQQGQQSNQNQVKKKRRRIMEESSSDEESSDDIPSSKKKSSTNVINGLVIRERLEDVGAEANKKISSLDEIKRQAGVSATQLEQGFDQIEGEEFKSTMAANEDDVKEGFLADFGNPSTAASASSPSSSVNNERKCPHLVSAVTQFQLLRKNDEYQNRYLCNHDAEDLWKDFLILATEQWKEAVNVLLKVRKDISSGAVKKSSDEAYAAREKCREVNMLLGIHCLDIHDFLSSEVSSLETPNSTPMSLSFKVLLSQTDHCFLLAAEEASKNALILVLEQEECQKTLPDSMTNRFVKGQHFLLRGRAQHNIGQAYVEQSQCKFLVNEGNRRSKQRLLKLASKEFTDSLNSANLCRGNTTSIYGHSDAGHIDKDTGCTWTSNAMRQSFEALKLVSLTSRSYGISLWELGEMEKAENTFCGTADLSDYLNFLGDEQISSEEVVDALCDPYWCAMTLAEFATRSLEGMSVRGTSNEKKGNDILRMVKLALQQARLVSDKILALASEHSIENMNYDISTREQIDADEKSICDMWEKKKVLSKKNITQPQNIALENVTTTAFPRRDIGEVAHSETAAGASRKIFIRDGGTSSSLRNRNRRRKDKQKKDERQAASENFNDAFGDDGINSNFDGAAATSNFDPTLPTSQHHDKYLKWGDELLDDHERNAYPSCCPPLPPNIPLNIKMAITARLGDILPNDDKLVAKLYNS